METLGPFHNRPAELELYQPLIGDSMLELGGKINAPYTYKAFFEKCGFRHVSVDWNGQHGALSLDLRKPLGLGTFDMVSNIGTSEHVDQQEPCWRNILEAMHIGSVLVSTTPKPGQWKWHGIHYPERDFFVNLASLNGLQIERLYENGTDPRRMLFFRAVKVEDVPFQMPEGNMFLNRR